MHIIHTFFVFIAIGFVKFYKYCVSPLVPMACRFTPTCSQYTEQAIRKHGFLKGSILGIKRICKCHPWGGSGYDPVPHNT